MCADRPELAEHDARLVVSVFIFAGRRLGLVGHRGEVPPARRERNSRGSGGDRGPRLRYISEAMFQTVVEALSNPHPCPCDCFHTLTLEERTRGVVAMYRFDDALRGWGYEPVYDLAADRLYRLTQQRNDPNIRVVAVRDTACVYRRFVGFAVHEVIHAALGDTTKANYGIPWGAPYSVPDDVVPGQEAKFLEPFNRAEALAFIGVEAVAEALFEIDWTVYTARDVGTYGFPGGNALVPAPPGCRPVPHWDSTLHTKQYYELARRLERDARRALDDAMLARIVRAFEDAERKGRALAKGARPAPEKLAAIAPRVPGRNDLCVCGSAKKYKKCCGAS
jgi:hypothetical protein